MHYPQNLTLFMNIFPKALHPLLQKGLFGKMSQSVLVHIHEEIRKEERKGGDSLKFCYIISLTTHPYPG